jgi:hypothetical protein
VGNGFSLGMRAHVGAALDDWDTSSPLAWRDDAGQPLIRHFPRFAAAVESPQLSIGIGGAGPVLRAE